MTQYFVRNITRVCLPETICKIFVPSLFYPVQRALFVVAFVAKYERYIVAHDAKEFQKTFRLGHGKVARQYRRNGQGKICEFNDVEPRKFHKAVYAVSAHKVTLPGDCHVVAMQLLAMT